MSIRKSFTVLVVGISLLASLTACSGSNEESKSSSAADVSKKPGAKTTLKYWTSARHDAEYIKEVIAKFNETNQDNIEVVFTGLSDNYNQALDVAFSSGQSPDVFQVDDLATYVLKDYVAPIDDYMTVDDKEKFGSGFVDNVNTFGGKLYSLPAFGVTYRLVYNQELFEKAGITSPPKTIKEMVDDAKKITEMGKKDGIYGFALNFKNPKSAFDRSARQVLSVSGYHGFGYDVKSGRFDFQPYSEVVKYYKQMFDDGSMLPGVESLDIDPLRAQFAQGKIGMYLSFSVEPGVYKDQFPTDIKWAAAETPTLDGTQKGPSLIAGGSWLGISQESKDKDAAWKFMAYMYSDDVQQVYHEKGLGLSLIPSVVAKAKNPDIAGIEYFIPTEKDALWPASPVVTPEGLNYGDVFFKYVLSGGNLGGMVQDLNSRYNAALDKAIAKGDVTIKGDPSFDPSNLFVK